MENQTLKWNQEAVLQYRDKTVLVAGAARSGLAAAELLLALGARVLLYDEKKIDEIKAIPEALRNGHCELHFGESVLPLISRCDRIILSPGIPLTAPWVAAARENGIPVVGELAFAASCAISPLIAITGTNGKTTTVSLLGEIFRQAGKIVFVTGNIGYPLSAAVLRAGRDDLFICEVSSFQLETVETFHPCVAVMLNITPDHLDRHGSMEAYIKLKQRIFENMDQSDFAVLNQDDPLVRDMAQNIRAQLNWFSRTQPVNRGAALREGWIEVIASGEAKRVCEAGELNIPGDHNLENALAAVAAANTQSVPLPVIAYALRQFKGVEHRIEYVRTVNGVRYINDSKGTNPDSTIKAIQTMKDPTVLIAGGYDKHVAFDSLAKSVVLSGRIKHAVLIGETAAQIEEALWRAGFADISHVGRLDEAVKTARGLAAPGGCVLFSPACASFDMFHDYEERGRLFKQIVEGLPEQEESI